jgi:hypothetical protein
MALTELQLPERTAFYRELRGVAGEAKSRSLRWNEISEFIQTVGTADLDAMGVPVGQVRTDLVAFRTSLDNIVTAIEAEYVTLDKFRAMAIL